MAAAAVGAHAQAMNTITHARRLAEHTPANRNRYVDFLRAVSILAVVIGHWLIAAPVVRDGDVSGVNLLAAEPWTQTLTWVFQVMPIFFVVGGYSNAVSWRAARRDGSGYGAWLGSRLRRLVLPAAPLVGLWSVIAVAGRIYGMEGELLRLGSQAALIPLWFLAVYVMVVAATPVTLGWWERHGVGSFLALAGAALVVDVARVPMGELVGWANFGFVWAAVHQMGYAWRDGRLATARSLTLGAAGLVLLVLLTTVGPYPISMVGVPGAVATNNSPPTVALIALGMAQAGFLLALERPASRWLAKRGPWAATIVVNGSIMTLYLWHLTVMVLLIGAGLLAGGAGLGWEPASASWWLTRPAWLALLGLATLPFLATLGRFERPRPGRPMAAGAALAGAGLACLGFAVVAGGGIGNADQWIRPLAVAPILLAAGWLWWQGRPRATT
jgi:fucose 4-O-acetylase-like acetyltransferase